MDQRPCRYQVCLNMNLLKKWTLRSWTPERIERFKTKPVIGKPWTDKEIKEAMEMEWAVWKARAKIWRPYMFRLHLAEFMAFKLKLDINPYSSRPIRRWFKRWITSC